MLAIESTAGLAWDGGYLPGSPNDPHASAHDNTSIAGWDGIEMRVKYLSGPGDIQMRLFLHTGLTGASAYPSNDATNDSKWDGALQTLSVATSSLAARFALYPRRSSGDNLWPPSGSSSPRFG
jgi:hypothetical protein